MFNRLQRVVCVAALVAATCMVNMALAHTIWDLQPGSTFFDASTGLTEALTGTMTMTTIDFSGREDFLSHGWTYVRQNITAIDIHGATVRFSAAGVPFGGGAIDICNEGNGTKVCQVQIIVQDTTRFTDANNVHFTGTAFDPTSFALVDLFPFFNVGGSLGIEAADRMTLFLAVRIPTVSFAAFTPTLALTFGPRIDDVFEVQSRFTLGTNSNGINLATDPVTLTLTGVNKAFAMTIPAGAFTTDRRGRFTFKGTINGVTLDVTLTVLVASKHYVFTAEGQHADLTGLTLPVIVTLTIGDDHGSTQVTARFTHPHEERS